MVEVDIKNVGPIESLTIPCPKDGGLVVLKGRNGAGKSTALRAISKVLGATQKGLSARDGQRRGTVTIGDCNLSITRARSTKKGEFECDSIEGRFDISKLVDPQIADEEKADAARIKALVNLSGVAASVEPYRIAIDGFDDLGVEHDTSDPVALAGRVKRKIEAEARKQETIAANKLGESKSLSPSHDINLDDECDEEKLLFACNDARDNLSRIDQQIQNAERNALAKNKAKEEFERIRDDTIDLDRATAQKSDAEKTFREAEESLKRAKQIFEDAKNHLEIETSRFETAVSHKANVEKLRLIIDSDAVDSPTKEQLFEAEARLKEAMDALQRGALIRKAKDDAIKSRVEREKAKKAKDRAETLRQYAKSVDDILSSQLPDGVLRIDDGRIVTKTDRSDSELYSELSDGERYKIAIDLVADQIEEGGLIVIPQHAFEGLTESTRNQIQEHLKMRKVVAVTASANDCELCSEVI